MKSKIDAIFDLRHAAEEHGRAELALEQEPTQRHRDALLDARLELEEKTHEAVASCAYCGRPHASGATCNVVPLRPLADGNDVSNPGAT